MKQYSRARPWHWVLALFSNTRKSDYLKPGTLHVEPAKFKATQRLKYWLRNPAHDFKAYVLGFVGEPEFRTVKGDGENTLKPGLILALRAYKWLRLPFIAYQSRWAIMGRTFQFYWGWRPTGALGAKFRFTVLGK